MTRKREQIITSADVFRNILDTVILDISKAADYSRLFENLLAAKEGAFTKAVSQSQVFWSFVYGATSDAAVFRLCRVYDQNKDALTLRSLLETVQTRPAYFGATNRLGLLIDYASFDADLKFASEDSNPVVKNLMVWRHKEVMHRDLGKAVARDLAEKYPVSGADVALLLERGFKILNRIGVAFFGSSFLPEIHGADDYLKVLKTLQADVESREARHRADVERARREA